jgi:RNA polymerase sigma-70 factor (ECF subfamily)
VFKRSVVGSLTKNSQLFEALFESTYDAIYRYCLRRLGPADAEDAAADVFAVAWRRLADLPDGDQGRAWLYGVANKVVSNQYRGRARRLRLSQRLDRARTTGSLAIVPDPEEGDFGSLYAALSSLSRTDQELLRLSAWDGLARHEIAAVLNIKENAVDQRLHRARTRLASQLDSKSVAVPLDPRRPKHE